MPTKVTINIYSFDELNDKAKKKAIEDHADFLESEGQEYENKDGIMEWDYERPDDETTIDNIEANQYSFFKNGDLADVKRFFLDGKLDKIEFNFTNETFII